MAPQSRLYLFYLKTKTCLKEFVYPLPEKDFLEINVGPKSEREKIDRAELLESKIWRKKETGLLTLGVKDITLMS